jgi:hypothetical protein
MNSRDYFDNVLPFETLQDELMAVLAAGDFCVELDGQEVTIPRDPVIQLVVRVARRYEINIGLGELSAVLAVGGIESVRNGVVEAGICFATVRYNADGKRVTVDFSKSMP